MLAVRQEKAEGFYNGSFPASANLSFNSSERSQFHPPLADFQLQHQHSHFYFGTASLPLSHTTLRASSVSFHVQTTLCCTAPGQPWPTIHAVVVCTHLSVKKKKKKKKSNYWFSFLFFFFFLKFELSLVSWVCNQITKLRYIHLGIWNFIKYHTFGT